jgi:hypothetical protein
MGSRLAFGCMRNVGYGLGSESVASWGLYGCGCVAGCGDVHVRCITLVLGLW